MPVMLRRLWIQLTADRRRFGLLCTVLGVGLLLWARLIVVSNLPRTAVASDGAVASSNPASGPASAATGSAAAPARKDAQPRAPIAIALSQLPARDPFVISPFHFPKPTSIAKNAHEAGKSAVEPVEDSQTREARITAQLAELAGRFSLEAAMRGGSMAAISGKTYRLNEQVPGVNNPQVLFKLVEIRHRSVILECLERKFELHMASPGG